MLTLTMMDCMKNGNMLDSAISLFHKNVNLEYVKLKQAHSRWDYIEDIRLVQIGTYLLSRDKNGQPVDLAVREWGVRNRGFLYGHKFSRYFRHPFPLKIIDNDIGSEVYH